MELEELVLELEGKCKIKSVIHKMEQLLMDGKIIRSIEDMGDALNEQPSKAKTRVVKSKEWHSIWTKLSLKHRLLLIVFCLVLMAFLYVLSLD